MHIFFSVDGEDNNEELNSVEAKNNQIRNCILLSIAYSSNIGGTGTIIGAGPNLVLKGILSQ